MSLDQDTQVMSFKKSKLLEVVQKEKVQELAAVFERQEMLYLSKISKVSKETADAVEKQQLLICQKNNLTIEKISEYFKESTVNNRIMCYSHFEKAVDIKNIKFGHGVVQIKPLQQNDAEREKQLKILSTNRLTSRLLNPNLNPEQ